MAKKDVHVVRAATGSKWAVNQGSQTRSAHRTQLAAITAGKRVAKRDAVDLVVHGRDGKIRSKDSYGNESKVKDKEH